MQSLRRCFLVITLAAALVTQTACAPNINALKGAVSAFAPLITVLVAQKKITQEKADLYTRDANLLIDNFGVLSTDWKAAKNNADKAAAIQRFANANAPVAGDFVKVEQLAAALAVLNTTLAVIQAFYGGAPPSASRDSSLRVPKDERALGKYVKDQEKLLKQMLQPK